MLLYEKRSFTALRVSVIVCSNELLICKTDRKKSNGSSVSMMLGFHLKAHFKRKENVISLLQMENKGKENEASSQNEPRDWLQSQEQKQCVSSLESPEFHFKDHTKYHRDVDGKQSHNTDTISNPVKEIFWL